MPDAQELICHTRTGGENDNGFPGRTPAHDLPDTAHGLRAIDGPFGDIKDPDGYVLAARRDAALGIEGKWAIHPSQVALANGVFSPPVAEVDRARRILAALDEAARAGKGAAQLDGRMIDAASARQAQVIVEIGEKVAARMKTA